MVLLESDSLGGSTGADPGFFLGGGGGGVHSFLALLQHQ